MKALFFEKVGGLTILRDDLPASTLRAGRLNFQPFELDPFSAAFDAAEKSKGTRWSDPGRPAGLSSSARPLGMKGLIAAPTPGVIPRR
jgi:hypothetical protein